jgi:hypothetical protein
VHRPHLVDMRQHRADAARPGLEAFVAQKRIEPDQAAGAPVPVVFEGPAAKSYVCGLRGEPDAVQPLDDKIAEGSWQRRQALRHLR